MLIGNRQSTVSHGFGKSLVTFNALQFVCGKYASDSSVPQIGQMPDKLRTSSEIIVFNIRTVVQCRIVTVKKQNRGAFFLESAVEVCVRIWKSASASFYDQSPDRFVEQLGENPPFCTGAAACYIYF